MKKVLLTAAAIFAFGFANAQEVKFGAKAGLNMANVNTSGDGSEGDDYKSIIGFHVGGFAEIKISDKFAFQPELLFSTQGAKSEYSESAGGYTSSGETKTKLSYLNIPLMAKYFVAEKFSLELGPQIGFLMSADQDSDSTVTGPGINDSESTSTDIKDDMKSIDFGLNFGAGYDFTENLSAGLRYNLGLSNTADYENMGSYKAKNSVLSLSVGYKF